jgi:hypothetical protein
MPTIFYQEGFRFFFFSNEHEPMHVHVEKGDSTAKFNLLPVTLVKNGGLKPKELKKAQALVSINQGVLLEAWKTHFGT